MEEMLEKQLELVRARKGSEREQELERRLAELEQRFEARPAEEKADALDELDEEEWALINAHRAGKGKPEPAADPEPEPERKPRRTRPGRKSGMLYEYTIDESGQRHALDIPSVWSGADEPDEVELPDEEEAA